MADLQIIDCHTHILRSKEHGQEIWRYFLSQSPLTGHPEEPVTYGTVPELQKLMQATGVVHTNILMFTWAGRYYNHGKYTLPDDPARREQADKDLRTRIAQRIIDNNEWAVSAVKENSNLSFFCGVDAVVMDEQTLVGEVADKTSRGALGAKMVPFDMGIRGDDRRLWPLYDYCQAREIPIWTETSGNAPQAPGRPVFFNAPLKEFPRLKLVFSHFGHDPKFGEGADAEAAEIMNAYDSVYADCSLRLPEVADGHVTPEQMVAHLRKLGAERVMYGSNFVFVELIKQMRGPSVQGEVDRPVMTETKKGLEALKTLPLTDKEREDIAGKNFQRLTGVKV